MCAIPRGQRQLRFYSALSSLVVAFETTTTPRNALTTTAEPWQRHLPSEFVTQAPALYTGFKGTFRFVRRSKPSILNPSTIP